MDNLFSGSVQAAQPQRKEDFWLDLPPSGFGRLLLAVAVIGVAACLLDDAAAARGAADTVRIASYGSSRQGSWE
ncbi:hypothetical protein FJW06_20045 [Mesorhizobium sp. B4-1-3]|uniref:hypothetical protein n=1 Tax=Mesorhizobium sp. B4-1-3 TaxID=2589889 RepID=UPI00112D973C|nr:hypothetical protein [Mesorhizobium sp. B4-1-3]TPI11347.1 hypothetical protein FJW06_20045 [Mesorhizobium sp. B4-1-3]